MVPLTADHGASEDRICLKPTKIISLQKVPEKTKLQAYLTIMWCPLEVRFSLNESSLYCPHHP